MRRVVVHIDRLVLEGCRPEDRHALAASLRAELTRRLACAEAANGVAALGEVTDLRAGDVRVPPAASPVRVGRAIARAISREMVRGVVR